MNNSNKSEYTLKHTDNSAILGAMVADPWDQFDSEASNDSESWLIGYVDILTLMLTLVVLLLAYNQIQKAEPTLSGIANPKVEQTKTLSKPSGLASDRHANGSNLAKRRNIRAGTTQNYLFPHKKVPHAIFAKPSLDTLKPAQQEQIALPKLNTTDGIQTAILDQLIIPLDLNTASLIQAQHFDTADKSLEPANVAQTSIDKQSKNIIDDTDPVSSYQSIIGSHGLGSFIDINQVAGAIRLEVNESILFAVGSAELKPQGLALLRELAEMFRKQPGMIDIEGHTDNVPIDTELYPSNWELASGRATAVARYLIEQAVNPGRLRAIGFADTRPRAKNDTVSGRSKNRRVSLVVTLDQSQNPS